MSNETKCQLLPNVDWDQMSMLVWNLANRSEKSRISILSIQTFVVWIPATRTFLSKMAFSECEQVWQVLAKVLGECRQVWQVLAKLLGECWCKPAWWDKSFYVPITCFICIKRPILRSLHLPNSPNFPKCTKLAFTWIPIFIILAKLGLREYLFLSHLPNWTCVSHNFNAIFAVWQKLQTFW